VTHHFFETVRRDEFIGCLGKKGGKIDNGGVVFNIKGLFHRVFS
jgi:hypothetical protein